MVRFGKYPQPFSRMYCDDCQGKNRGNEGWIYNSPTNALAKLTVERNKNVIKEQSQRLELDITSYGPLPEFIYFCKNCQG